MRLPRPIAASAIGALALSIGVVGLQAPAAAAAEVGDPRTLRAPIASAAEATPGEEISFEFRAPSVAGFAEGTRGAARIVLRSKDDPRIDRTILQVKRVGQQPQFLYQIVPPVSDSLLCAVAFWPGERLTIDDGSFDDTTTIVEYPLIEAETCLPITEASTIFPRAPYLSSSAADDAIYPKATAFITAHLGGGIFSQEQVLGRAVTTGFTSSSNPARCLDGVDVQTVNAASAGSGPYYFQRTIPGGTVGKYFCMQQSVKTDRMSDTKISEPVTYLVTSNPNVSAGGPVLNLGGALQRLQQATQRLQQVQGQPNVDQAALAAAAAEAEEARRQAQGAAARAAAQAAQAQAQGQAPAAGAPSAAQIAEVQQAAEAATTVVEQAIGSTTVGTGKQTAATALAIATGFDPFTTPVLQPREKNASGVSIEVTAPDSIRQKKRLRTQLNVLDPVTRGGMRQYLLDLNGPTPQLLLKRTGFVPNGVEKKRFWISKNFQPGTYGLLTTFAPSTPGMQGLAAFDTIEVTEFKKKKKKKGKKKRN